MAGDAMNHNSTTNGMVDAAAASIRGRDADFVALNEVCASQFRALVTRLRDAGWPVDGANFARFEGAYPAGHAVCGGEEQGVAIFSKRPLGPADRFTLPDDGKREKRKLLCAALKDRPHARFCATHLTFVDAYRKSQVDAVRAQLEEYHRRGDTVILAGDFNMQPDWGRMDDFYSAGVNTPHNDRNAGHYHELDDNDPAHCAGYGEPTVSTPDPQDAGPCGTGAKIDFIFAREDRIAGAYSADSLAPSTQCGGALCSDHRVLVGSVTVSVDDAPASPTALRTAGDRAGRIAFGDTPVRFPFTTAVVERYAEAKA
ncbi:endonuclease/exonuclease/phosphatase family protein [Streptomyces griseocarneus]|nr:endonuclease/exonuclease/phosphatase family protein [Streptomyces griseocarneus]MBZ6477796.1 endonuclease/exonuclease/phosphatase family protein [Streptomyces griseocarneus]